MCGGSPSAVAVGLDRSFVDTLGRDAESVPIVAAMVDFSHDLGLKVVAEGIETTDQLERLKKMGCELGQGYHFAKPLKPCAAAELLSSNPQLV